MPRCLRRHSRLAAPLLALAAVAVAPLAAAAPYKLTYSGTFNTSEALNLATASSPSFFAATTAFTIHALFDDSTPSQVPPVFPFLGFTAYVPSLATIEIAGAVYTIESAATNPAAGVTVSIFDTTNIFNPGRYGIGLIADVINDGAGIVGDFVSASVPFAASSLVPTTFTDYYGVGHGSGVCLSGMPPDCPHAVTPWVLRDAFGVAWDLTLGNYLEDYPISHIPGVPVGSLNSASISAVSEPATIALMLAGLAASGAVGARRKARQRQATLNAASVRG